MTRLPDSISVTAIRNEGPFLLQWIAWQRALGFDRVLVMHNDCTDHSPQLLRLLARHGAVLEQQHHPDPAKAPQPQAHLAATAHPAVQAAEWCLVSDVDERLVVHRDDGSVAALASMITNAGAIGMAVNWRIFGTRGEDAWDDRILHRHFTRAAAPDARQNSGIKTFFRRPADWERLRTHGPRGWRGHGNWGKGANRLILADGSAFDAYGPDSGQPRNWTDRDAITHEAAQISHYALQSTEQFMGKQGTPSASTRKDRYTFDFFTRFDRNEAKDHSALRLDAAFQVEWDRLQAIPGAARLHDLCCVDYVLRLGGRDPVTDPRLPRFLMRAAG